MPTAPVALTTAWQVLLMADDPSKQIFAAPPTVVVTCQWCSEISLVIKTLAKPHCCFASSATQHPLKWIGERRHERRKDMAIECRKKKRGLEFKEVRENVMGDKLQRHIPASPFCVHLYSLHLGPPDRFPLGIDYCYNCTPLVTCLMESLSLHTLIPPPPRILWIIFPSTPLTPQAGLFNKEI